MSRRPNRWGANDPDAERRAQDHLTGAFLDMDKRQTIAQNAVDAVEVTQPQSAIPTAWTPVREACYEASAAYLRASGSGGVFTEVGPRISLEQTTSMLTAAAARIDQFYGTYRPQLEHAAAAVSGIPVAAAAALTAAHASAQSDAATRYGHYRSVRDALARVTTVTATLAEARVTGSYGQMSSATTELNDAVSALDEVLAHAPQAADRARHALASLRTRIAAVRTRSERLPEAFSALLREFNAASSADLSTNVAQAAQRTDRAEATLTLAASELDAGDADAALESTTNARALLSEADELVDAVTDRLDLLREVRANPRERLGRTRFALRDAQMLAVDRRLVPQWGSVLDAQSDRIERAEAALVGVHPDYWAYARELSEIEKFISGVVARMRGIAH